MLTRITPTTSVHDAGHLGHKLWVVRLAGQAVRGVAHITTVLAVVLVLLKAVKVHGHLIDIATESLGHRSFFRFLAPHRWSRKKERRKRKKNIRVGKYGTVYKVYINMY